MAKSIQRFFKGILVATGFPLFFSPGTALAQAAGWHIETVDGGNPSADTGSYNSIAINAAGPISIGYYDATNKDPKFAKRNSDGSWQIRRVNENINKTTYPDLGPYLSMDLFGDTLHFSFAEVLGTNLRYYTFDATQETLPNSLNLTLDGDLPGTGAWSSLSVASNGDVHVSLRNAQNIGAPCTVYNGADGDNLLFHKWLSGGTWRCLQIAGAIDGTQGLAVDSNHAHMIYSYLNTATGTGRVRYRRLPLANIPATIDQNSDSWSEIPGDYMGPYQDIGAMADARDIHVSVDGDASGNGHLCWYDPVRKLLRYARYDPSAITVFLTELVDGSVARVLDLLDLPHDLAPRWEGRVPATAGP